MTRYTKDGKYLSFGGLQLSNPYHIPKNGLVGEWLFNGNVDDTSGNDYNGILIENPTLINDRFGNSNSAYNLNGIDQYIEVPNYEDLTIREQLTISVWFKTSQTNDIYILNKSGLGYFAAIGVQEATKLEFYTEDVSSPNWLSGTKNVTDDNWHHGVFIYDYSGGINNRRIYLDGIIEASDTKTGIIGYNTNPLLIGTRTTAGPLNELSLDDLRIYNRVLSQIEINYLYNERGYTP